MKSSPQWLRFFRLVRAAFLQAVLLFAALYAAEPTELQEIMKAAGSAMQRQDFAAAEKHYRRLLQHVPDAAELHSNLGLALYFQKKYELAERAFSEALSRSQELYVPNFFLGKLYFETSQYQKALPRLEQALKAQPQQRDLRQLRAAVLVGLERFDEAVAEYRQLIKESPEDVDLLYGLSLIYLDLGQKAFDRLADSKESGFRPLVIAEFYADKSEWTAVAERNFRKAVAASPNIPGLRTRLGMFLLKFGKHREAIKVFEEEIDLDSYAYRARFGLALALAAEGQTTAAATQIDQATKIRPEFFDPLPAIPDGLEQPRQRLGRAELEQKASDGSFGAAALLAISSAGSPQSSEWVPLAEKLRDRLPARGSADSQPSASPAADEGESTGLEYLRRKAYEEGLEILLPQKTMAVQDAEVLVQIVRALHETGRYEEMLDLSSTAGQDDPELIYLRGLAYKELALQTMDVMVEKHPDSARARQLLGDSLLAQQKLAAAVKAYKQAAEIEPRDAEIYYALGNAHFRQSDFQQAGQAYEKALEISPLHGQAAYMRGRCLVELGEPERAVILLQKALEMEPQLRRARVPLGKALAALNRNEEAIETLKLAASADSDGTIHYQLFRLYRKVGRGEKAREALARSKVLRTEAEKARETSFVQSEL